MSGSRFNQIFNHGAKNTHRNSMIMAFDKALQKFLKQSLGIGEKHGLFDNFVN